MKGQARIVIMVVFMVIVALVGYSILTTLFGNPKEKALEDFKEIIEDACTRGIVKSGSIFVPSRTEIKIQQGRIEIEGEKALPLNCNNIDSCTIKGFEGSENIEFNVSQITKAGKSITTLEGNGIECAQAP